MHVSTDKKEANNANNSDIVQQAILKSNQAYRELSSLPQSCKETVVAAIKGALIPLAEELTKMEVHETGMGNACDKAAKLMLALHKTPGLEDLELRVSVGDCGITLHEYSAYGIICATQPAANFCATVANNIIGIVSAGNSVIIAPHPRCLNVSGYMVKLINDAVSSASGIDSLAVSLPSSSMELVAELMSHPDVAMVVATGGGKIIKQALASSKRVIGAGAANPVAMVDETADLDIAAKNIADGASFDHNTTCVGEKNIVVVSSVADKLIEELEAKGAFYVRGPDEVLKLTKAAINNSFMTNRSLAGKSAVEILKAAEIRCDRDVRLIVAETTKTHPFVTVEMPMPLVPLVRVSNYDELLEMALFMEQGHRHTATIHSQSIARLNKAAQVMQTSIFVRNGSALSALGFGGGVGAGFTIANITGEGVTTARNFARLRRC
ncbi:MAG: aldehyde dehydrogenase [Oscillospiraceae bacterium]|nr:aldehyde dehydrogenase [Oscillospiraceae bacterium]